MPTPTDPRPSSPPEPPPERPATTAAPIRRRTTVALAAVLAVAGWAAAGSLGLLAATPAQAQPARYEIDPDHLAIGFLVDHIAYAKVLGMFRSARGSYRFDEARAELSELRVEVDTDSVFTNHRRRDDHLKGPDFLHSGQFPRMVFTAAGARRSGERTFEIAGQLELLGRSQPLTLQATWNKSAESPIGGLPGRRPYVMGVSARGSFKRSAYGMDYGVANGWVGDEVELIIEFEAIRR